MVHNSEKRLDCLRRLIKEDGEANSWLGYKGTYMGYEPERVYEIAKDAETKSYKYYEKMCKNCGFHAVKDLCRYAYHDNVHIESSQNNLLKKLNEYAPGTKQKYKNRVKNRIVGGARKDYYLKVVNGELSCAALMMKKRIREKEINYYHQKLQEIEIPFAIEDNPVEPDPEKIELDLSQNCD